MTAQFGEIVASCSHGLEGWFVGVGIDSPEMF